MIEWVVNLIEYFTMNDKTQALNEEISLFKSQMLQVNKIISSYESDLNLAREEVHILRGSFATLMKLMNAELINSLDKNTSLLEKIVFMKKD